MLTVPQAVAEITKDIAPRAVERVALLDSLGRVLARDAVARYTLPQWDNSAMDGYAVRATDIEGATAEQPVVLPVLETIAAGAFASRALRAGETMRIMTGAPLPEGADTVVRVEDTDGGIERVAIRNTRDTRKNIRPRGEDFREGSTVIAAGTPLAAAQLGVLASLGYGEVDVHRRPVVAIAGSGDELVDIDQFDEVIAGKKIVASNRYTLDALVRQAGGIPRHLGNAADTPESLRAVLEQSRGADMLVTSAGASVGEYDYTRQVLESLGADLRFWRVRMRPGAPLGFGTLDGMPWIGLPGNPVSAMVTFELFARPVIRRMLGHIRLFRRPVPAVLDEPVNIGAKLMHFLRAITRVRDDGTLAVRLTGPQGSGILTSMSQANALLIVPEDRSRVEAGERLNILPLAEDAQLSENFSL
ncbi:MAG TPA: gephyrin-like molybdotransferase Glp [Gemmatimonadaceae bacterium]|nr:gephyrin-like molybdotransferase Glp [Gemmatimonadaceae bacterium]